MDYWGDSWGHLGLLYDPASVGTLQERPAECLLGSVTSVRFIAAIHASTFHKAETEAATAFVVLNSGLELYADLIAREGEPAW